MRHPDEKRDRSADQRCSPPTGDGQIAKLVTLVNLVPPMRRSLELLLYKVKALLIEVPSHTPNIYPRGLC